LDSFIINILLVGIVLYGIVIPLFCTLLDKRGNSITEKRCSLMDKLLNVISSDQIQALVADPEIIGTDSFHSLELKRLLYAIRIKENEVIITCQGEKSIH